MGQLYYGTFDQAIDIPDRVLAHVKVVTATKLRRGESFTLSWRHGDDEPAGRSTLWMQPSIPLRFVFDNPEPEALDPEYLKRLAHSANSSAGISMTWHEEDAAASAPLRAVPAA
ncbi:hypothetical protein ACIGCK_02930 [Microbacterium sp. NPDC078428]|uniref:DUF7882 family protein n=1 Tax=Microbacterium sp. NPDC078428 TaxID=3364190 RepID=UPI0037C50DF0